MSNIFLARSAHVVPFPRSDQFDGVVPLHISGGVISADTDQSRAVWEWLSFLSYQYPNRVARQVPARPSVARANLYWESLPPAIQQTMLQAFPNSRPILLAEQALFTDEQLTAALSED